MTTQASTPHLTRDRIRRHHGNTVAAHRRRTARQEPPATHDTGTEDPVDRTEQPAER